MKTKLIAMLMLAGSTMFAGPRVFVGLNFGAPVVPVAPVAVAYATPCPGPGYVWVDGYYNFVGGRRIWTAGYWRAPVYAPRYNRGFVERRVIDRDHDRRFDRGFRR